MSNIQSKVLHTLLLLILFVCAIGCLVNVYILWPTISFIVAIPVILFFISLFVYIISD